MNKRVKTRIRRKNMGIKILLLIILLIFILFKIIIPNSITLAKYAYNKTRNYYLSAKGFYFNSDKLSDEISNEYTGEQGAYFEASNWSGIDPYEIEVRMDSKKNSIEGAIVDIPYTITYDYEVYHSDGTEYTQNPSEIIVVEMSKASGTIFVSNNNTDYFRFEVSSQIDLAEGDYVLIHIATESTGPFEKELYGTFKISIGNLGTTYKISDAEYNPYLEFTITNTLDHSTRIKLDFDPNIVVIDTTSAIYISAESNGDTHTRTVGGYEYVDSITFDVEAEEGKTIRFYKKDASRNYTYPGTAEPIIEVTPL